MVRANCSMLAFPKCTLRPCLTRESTSWKLLIVVEVYGNNLHRIAVGIVVVETVALGIDVDDTVVGDIVVEGIVAEGIEAVVGMFVVVRLLPVVDEGNFVVLTVPLIHHALPSW